MHITIHLANPPAADATTGNADTSALMSEAIHNFFNYKTDLVRGNLEQLLGLVRASLLIGL